mmetsp:Transcript_91089/g.257349  ORF Transcript_91089/g.257349 Transcript_91089/m.257349 type:complete len:496 (-) Transcript_91089:368-1855(-)
MRTAAEVVLGLTVALSCAVSTPGYRPSGGALQGPADGTARSGTSHAWGPSSSTAHASLAHEVQQSSAALAQSRAADPSESGPTSSSRSSATGVAQEADVVSIPTGILLQELSRPRELHQHGIRQAKDVLVHVEPEPMPDNGVHDYMSDAMATNMSMMEIVFALAAGTGANGPRTGVPSLDIDLARRMHLQDAGLMVLLVLMYFVTLMIAASLLFRQVANSSRILFYADPRYFNLGIRSACVEAFLTQFNQVPQEVYIQIVGLVLGDVSEQDNQYIVAFNLSLDVSHWVVHHTCPSTRTTSNSNNGTSRLISSKDRRILTEFLAPNSNDLAVLKVVKEVDWPDWEELAFNIKAYIRQHGFSGTIVVARSDSETVPVYKNRHWANYMHCRSLKVLCGLSVIGWIFYLPYMYFRSVTTIVKTHFRVNISSAEYWPFFTSYFDTYGPWAENDGHTTNRLVDLGHRFSLLQRPDGDAHSDSSAERATDELAILSRFAQRC